MIKQQQFYVFRIKSSRLKEYKYNITLTTDQARKNKELISIGDSELIRQIRNHIGVDTEKLKELNKLKKTIKFQKSSDSNIKALGKIQKQIDDILFVPEVIVTNINSNSQYKNMFADSITVNDKSFKRFMCGSGHSRNSKVIFVEEETINRIKSKLENGYDNEKDFSANKFNAYFALYSSSTYKVRNLKFCVVKDLEVNIKRKVDFVFQDEEKTWVEELDNHSIDLKPHDGEGILTIRGAKLWAEDLEITDYIPGFFGIRNSFIKGMLISYPVDEYTNEISGTCKFIDAWGVERDSNDYDIFLTTSQLKLWKNYKSLEEFTKNCEDNNLSWGVCHVAPQRNNNYCLTNYQYLQTLDMEDKDIEELCKFNVDWFEDILGADAIKTALYLLGKGVEKIESIDDIHNPIVKAILLNNTLAKDTYIQTKIMNSIRKKIQHSYAGKVLVQGNYQTMLADPFSLCQNIFGEKPEDCTGLLNEGEHYSAYWNNKNVTSVDACRSPLTHYSEHNILNLQNHNAVNHWYRYQTTGIIYPTLGLDTIRHADSDFDLDLVFTSSSPVFLRCTHKDTLPITYEKKTAPINKLTEEAMFQADLLSFSNDIGTITNYSTDMYTMLEQFHKGGKLHNTILERLKITRMLQGNAIDKSKGVQVQDFPKDWITYQTIRYKDECDEDGNVIKGKEKDTPEQIKEKKFLNKLVIHKKPYFQGWIYSKYRKKYLEYVEKANLYCKVMFKLSLEELKEKRRKTKEENDYMIFHYHNLPLSISPSVMNKLCWHMESACKDIKTEVNIDNNADIVEVLKDKDIEKNDVIFSKVLKLYKDFCGKKRIHEKTKQRSYTKDKYDEESYDDLQLFYKQICIEAYKICSNTSELINYATEITYELHPKDKKDFLWDVFGKDVLINIEKNKQDKVLIPILDNNGTIEYLGDKFKLQEVIYDI